MRGGCQAKKRILCYINMYCNHYAQQSELHLQVGKQQHAILSEEATLGKKWLVHMAKAGARKTA